MNRFALSLFPILLFCASCIPAATPDLDYDEVSLIPGECLIDNNLTCVYRNTAIYGKEYQFWFTMNVDVQYEVMERGRYFTTIFPTSHRHRPSDNVFQQFGANAKKVKAEYDRIWSGLKYFSDDKSYYYVDSQSTFFIDGEITFTANKEFAGIPAGENLASLITQTIGRRITSYIEPFDFEQDNMLVPRTSTYYYQYGPSNNMDDYYAGEEIRIPLDKQAILMFSIPTEGCSFVAPYGVTFTLVIPIKSAQYLTWINDRLTDGNAPMTWKHEVLKCTFYADKGLVKKTD